MKLPSPLAKLANKVVSSDMPRFKEADRIGVLFDVATFKRAQLAALFEQFGDCERGDYADILVWPAEDDDESFGPKALKGDCMPFVLWCADELLDDREELKKRLAKNETSAKFMAFDSDGLSPQYQTMWFLHADGSVSYADIDGTFEPRKRSLKLVDHFDELKLRLSTPDDISEG